MGLDAIALKDDTESAKQGLSKLVSFINPDTETSEQNRLWAQESVPTNEWHITNQKTASMCVISYLIYSISEFWCPGVICKNTCATSIIIITILRSIIIINSGSIISSSIVISGGSIIIIIIIFITAF